MAILAMPLSEIETNRTLWSWAQKPKNWQLSQKVLSISWCTAP